MSFFKNLYYKLFWSPNKEWVYRSKDETHSFGHHGTITNVYFINKNEEYFVCTFCVHKNGKTEIRIKSDPITDERVIENGLKTQVSAKLFEGKTKKKRFIDTKKLSFGKRIIEVKLTGQGGLPGESRFGGRIFNYIVKERSG